MLKSNWCFDGKEREAIRTLRAVANVTIPEADWKLRMEGDHVHFGVALGETA